MRLGVPATQLDFQGRARPAIADLYRWRYGMTLGRVTIATSDFTPLPFYSYDDLADPNATDNNLTHFSVERDAGSTFGQ